MKTERLCFFSESSTYFKRNVHVQALWSEILRTAGNLTFIVLVEDKIDHYFQNQTKVNVAVAQLFLYLDHPSLPRT